MFDVVFLPLVWRNVAHTGVCVTSVAPTCSDSRLASLISISSAENVISACKLARKRLMKWVWQTAVIELACVAQESGTSFYHLLMESWVNRGSCVCVCLSILVCNTLRVNANVCVYVYFRIVFSWNSARTIKTRGGAVDLFWCFLGGPTPRDDNCKNNTMTNTSLTSVLVIIQ